MMDEQKLREYFDFDETDLDANRKGHLSEKQRNRLEAKTKYRPGSEWIVGSILFLIAGIGIFGGVSAILNAPSVIERIVFGSLFGVLWPYIWGKLGLGYIHSFRPKKNGRVKVERGRLRLFKRKAPDIIAYYELCVGDRTVELEDDLTDMVTQGDQYAMYYLANTKGMLSLEHISKGK
jgi:hypothetical protein